MNGAAVATPAKINWDLRVLGRRADGFHELRSWFLALDWRDRLAVAPAAAPAFALAGAHAAGVPADERNLVLRAERAWRAAFPEAARALPPLAWRLEKNLPAGAGLGGGSGNAAGALRLLEWLSGARHPEPRLRALAAALGSDVDFALTHVGGAEWRGGRGEELLARAPAPAVVLAVPDFPLATAAVFAALGPGGGAAPAARAQPGAVPGPNELEAAAWRVAPALAAFAARLRARAPFVMSGSGAAYFAPCASLDQARALAEEMGGASHGMRAAAILDGPALVVVPA